MVTPGENPQLDEDDLAEIKACRRDYMAGRKVGIDIVTRVVAASDDFFDVPTTTETVTTVSGVVDTIYDEDRLLALGGRVRVGDTRVTFFIDDVQELLDLYGISGLRRASLIHPRPSGLRYQIDVVEVAGLGIPNRVELGLVLEDGPP